MYGIRIRPKDDPYIQVAQKALEGISAAGSPGTFLVDTIPMCESLTIIFFYMIYGRPVKYVPEWMPGAGFKKKARLWRKPTVEMSVTPLMAVKKAMVSIAIPPFQTS